MRSLVSNSIYTKKDRNSPPSANQVVFIAKPRRAHAVCTLWVHPPTSPYPALSAEAEPISKDITGSNAESLMTDNTRYKLPKAFNLLNKLKHMVLVSFIRNPDLSALSFLLDTNCPTTPCISLSIIGQA